MIKDVFEQLKDVVEFHSVPPAQIEWLAAKGTLREFADGDRIIAKGEVIDGFQVVLSGGISMFIAQAGGKLDLGMYERGELLGRLPYSRMRSALAEGYAVGKVVLFELSHEHFPALIQECHELTEALVHHMTDRVRDFTRQQQQNEKMMALGKLSAGLAHELNNPSAAVVRSAQELKKHLKHVPEKFKQVMEIRADEQTVDQVNELVLEKINGFDAAPLSLIEKSALEDELSDWLDAHEVTDGYEMTEVFADFRVSVNDLDNLKAILRAEDLPSVVNWVHQALTTEKLVREIEEASKRINALVTSVKSYTHMGQAQEKALTDIRTGIRNTLTMLNHKIKRNNIEVIDHLPEDLPQAHICVSELNQVWTNLIDNAIDAMEGRKDNVLEIKAAKDREFIIVSIIDNGPGIPADVVDKIFDPFFTTKPIGKGTGLGLEVVRQIIHQQHNGKVDVVSAPGRTEFKVCFPI